MGSVTESPRGRWLVLTAALLGWMFDGLEIGLFPVVARPALRELLDTSDDAVISQWNSIILAGFLVGAATGGVLFGWLGDRVGRVRAMTLSILTYALFSAAVGVAAAAWQVAVLRFLAALGMGGEWSLGVALVMEVWPNNRRGLLAGLIGSAANLGFAFIAVVSLTQNALFPNTGWRLLMFAGVAPAVLTLFIVLFVPESPRWLEEKKRGGTSHWSSADLAGVGVGLLAALGMISLWAVPVSWALRSAGALVALAVITVGYIYPVIRYMQRAGGPTNAAELRPLVGRMLLAAALSGVALIGTWASIQWAPMWADQLTGGTNKDAKALTQFWSAMGSVVSCVLAAMLGDRIGRRPAFCVLCVGALASVLYFFQCHTAFDWRFLAAVFVAGGFVGSFYGWIPLYLPELFRTNVRATAQGFSYNFGRNLAAIGALQTSALMDAFDKSYPTACSIMSLVYVVGLGIIWLAPETRGRPLPD